MGYMESLTPQGDQPYPRGVGGLFTVAEAPLRQLSSSAPYLSFFHYPFFGRQLGTATFLEAVLFLFTVFRYSN